MWRVVRSSLSRTNKTQRQKGVCCLVDTEGNGERGGIYLCRPLPETLIQVNVPVPGGDSVQEFFRSGKMSPRAHGRGCRGYCFQTGYNKAG